MGNLELKLDIIGVLSNNLTSNVMYSCGFIYIESAEWCTNVGLF